MATNARDIGPLTLMVGAEIYSQRRRRDMRQDQLSELAGIAVSTISRMERGRSAIDLEQCERIAAAFGLTPEALIHAARLSASASQIAYRPDGTLDPEYLSGIRAGGSRMAELEARDDIVSEG